MEKQQKKTIRPLKFPCFSSVFVAPRFGIVPIVRSGAVLVLTRSIFERKDGLTFSSYLFTIPAQTKLLLS